MDYTPTARPSETVKQTWARIRMENPFLTDEEVGEHVDRILDRDTDPKAEERA